MIQSGAAHNEMLLNKNQKQDQISAEKGKVLGLMSKSVYDSPNNTIEINRHILTILVDNEPGVLARVIGMFSGAEDIILIV